MAGSTGDIIQAAKAKVQIPAIGLILTGVITVGLTVFGLISGGGADFDTQMAAEIKKIEDDQTKKDEEKKAAVDMMNKVRDTFKPFAGIMPVLQVVAVVVGLLGIISGIMVLSLKGRGLAMVSSILSMFPFISCCCLGIPFGIWLIIALNNEVVKRGFEAAAGGGSRMAGDLDPGFER